VTVWENAGTKVKAAKQAKSADRNIASPVINTPLHDSVVNRLGPCVKGKRGSSQRKTVLSKNPGNPEAANLPDLCEPRHSNRWLRFDPREKQGREVFPGPESVCRKLGFPDDKAI
jgi:hypothetical protein